MALLLLTLAFEMHTIGGTTDIQVLRWTLPGLGLACFAGALGAWMRPGRLRPVEAPSRA